MPRALPLHPCPRTLALENGAFLRALRRTGNADAAAHVIGRHPATMRKRRARLPAFADEWRAALVVAAARLHAKQKAPSSDIWVEAPRSAYRTKGGEPVIARGRGGRLIQRAAHPGRLTRACEQAFLLALSVTCNVGLSAAAADAPKAAFYRRRRVDPGFAREWRLALSEGYARLEQRCLAAADPASHEHDGWRHNETPEPPPMTINQMLQLQYLHQKEARLLAEPAHLKRRRGESREAQAYRLGAMYEENLRRGREAFHVAEAARAARERATTLDVDRIVLPDLAQVSADRTQPPKPPHDPDRALFGGWRIEEMAERLRDAAAKRSGRDD